MESELVESAISKSAGIEYSSFTTAIHLPKKLIIDDENRFKREGVLGKISTKTALNRALRKMLEERTGRDARLDGDITFIFDFDKESAGIKINPVFLLCRYNKYSRKLSQTRWVKYESVEDFIVNAAHELFECGNAFLHGAGREDVDVRMIGKGRLCVIEIEEPKKREVDFMAFESLVRKKSNGDVELHIIRRVDRDYVGMVKEARFDKEYEAQVIFGKSMNNEDIGKICSIGRIEQKTPLRVRHRRADRARIRKVHSMECTRMEGSECTFKIRCEAGTYIKELINGDGGRTVPNFSSIAGCSAECIQLDVINIYDEYIADWW